MIILQSKRLLALLIGSVLASGDLYADSLLPELAQHPNLSPINTPIDPDTKRPVSPFDPYLSGAMDALKPSTLDVSLYKQVKDLVVQVEGLNASSGMLPADGMTNVPVKIKVLDANGAPVKGKLTARIEVKGVRIASKSLSIDSVGKRLGRDDIELVDGKGQFDLIAPSSAMEATFVVTVGDEVVKGKIAFAPDVRPLIAAGIVEGVINLGRNGSSAITPSTGLSDGFERELRRWQRTFDNGDISIAGRTTFFLKGTIKGEYLLTGMFDSEKDTRQRQIRDINPDKYYPVMGDSAQRGYEAKSSERLYVRVDNGKSYVLYGDFQTGSSFSQALGGNQVAPQQQRNLGQYNRTMTGVRLYQDDGKGYTDSFAMRESMRQAIEEYRGNGTSGPFSIANLNAIENTEKIEIIVRDKNNVSRILSITPLTRYLDYTFEPFSGRILLKAALPSLDADLNPVSIRITYEVDTGGNKFWVYGVSGQRHINDDIEIGGSYVKDENPTRPTGTSYATTPGSGIREMRELISANVGVKTGENGKLILEVATTNSATADADIRGSAARFDWAQKGVYDSPLGTGLKYEIRSFGGGSQMNFNNPASSYTNGKVELGAKGFIELTKRTRLLTNIVYTEDRALNASRDGESFAIEHQLTPKIILDAGIRHVHQTEGAVLSLSSSASSIVLPGQGSAYGGSGLNPNGAGFWGLGNGLNPVTGQPQSAFNGTPIPSGYTSPAIDAYTVRAGGRYLIEDNWAVGAEVGQDYGFEKNPTWAALSTDYRYEKGRAFARVETPTGRATAGADYRVLENTSLYGRWEQTNGLASSYALDSAAKSQVFLAGVRNADGKGYENYSEMRMRDGMNQNEIESATGMRNTFALTDNLKANVMSERLKIFHGNGRSATALGGGLEYQESLWQGSARLEWRQMDRDSTQAKDNTTTSWMNTVSLARKIDDSWTGLMKNYLLTTDDQSVPGYQLQNRFQLGGAYRPRWTNDFDALLRYENKYEKNSEIVPGERRFVNLISANGNYHPSRAWWLNGRFAAKSVDETLTGVTDTYQAYLFSGRIIRDLNKDFDIGVMGSVMYSPQGQTVQQAYGLELGYLVQQNVWASAGYNFSGFSDRDLTGSDYTMQGLYLRLRMKFDEKDIEKRTDIFSSTNTKLNSQEDSM